MSFSMPTKVYWGYSVGSVFPRPSAHKSVIWAVSSLVAITSPDYLVPIFKSWVDPGAFFGMVAPEKIPTVGTWTQYHRINSLTT